MAEFKPMVKMYTDEPSVILKLKKGGKVKGQAADHGHHGHKAMAHVAAGHMHGAHKAFESEHGKAPKKPSMAERRRAMNPQQYAKGGKVAHKALGGGMMGVAPAAQAMPTPMGRPALMGMTPAQRAARAAMLRRAITGMKKGGHAGLEKHVAKLEKELRHHESMSMSKAHKAHKASGGEIDRDETRTTIEKKPTEFAKSKMVTAYRDRSHGTGEVKEDVPGGYKHGGRAHHGHGGKVHHISGHPEGTEAHHKAMCKHYAAKCKEGGSPHMHKMMEHHKHMAKMCKGGSYAVGGEVPADSKKSMNKGKIELGGTIEDNEHYYENTDVHTAVADKAHGTGGVSMSNAGGFRKGGKAKKYASGGNVDRYKIGRAHV